MPIPQIFYDIGYAVCHQLPQRTWHVRDQALPLCSRCTGIYLGMFLLFAFYFFVKYLRRQRPSIPPSLPIIIMSALFFIIMPINAISPHFGAPTHNVARLITGILFGFSVPLFLLVAFNYSTQGKNEEKRVIKLGEYISLLVLVAVATTLIIIGNVPALYFAAYASVAGLLIFATLLNATIVKSILEQRNKTIKDYQVIIIGVLLAAIELSIFHYSRAYIDWLILG